MEHLGEYQIDGLTETQISEIVREAAISANEGMMDALEDGVDFESLSPRTQALLIISMMGALIEANALALQDLSEGKARYEGNRKAMFDTARALHADGMEPLIHTLVGHLQHGTEPSTDQAA